MSKSWNQVRANLLQDPATLQEYNEHTKLEGKQEVLQQLLDKYQSITDFDATADYASAVGHFIDHLADKLQSVVKELES